MDTNRGSLKMKKVVGTTTWKTAAIKILTAEPTRLEPATFNVTGRNSML
ncbi:MAG TPA: hypothetical protein VGB00_10680 [Pyrinomonadaceae bacterium]